MRSAEDLRVRQERMKRKNKSGPPIPPRSGVRVDELVIPEGRKACIYCKRRIARLGSPYCSRCSGLEMTTSLRDILPGLPKPIVEEKKEVVPNVSTTRDGGRQPQLEVTGDHRAAQTSDMPTGEVTYNRHQVCEQVGVSATTLLRWERKGRTPQPIRIVHNGQCAYTKEMVDKILGYKNQYYQPPSLPLNQPGPVGQSLPRVQKSTKLSRGMERAVASRISSLGKRIF